MRDMIVEPQVDMYVCRLRASLLPILAYICVLLNLQEGTDWYKSVAEDSGSLQSATVHHEIAAHRGIRLVSGRIQGRL